MKPEAPSIKSLVFTWLILVALHFSILGAALLPIGFFKMPLILTMAVVQTALVMIFFMEAWHGGKLLRFFAVAGFFWLMIQFILVAADYTTRMWH